MNAFGPIVGIAIAAAVQTGDFSQLESVKPQLAEKLASKFESTSDDDAPAATQNIVEIAAGNSTFSTLVAAVEAAGLVDALASEGPFTVFAPTDEAFAKLPDGTIEYLLDNPEELAQILTYHVVSGSFDQIDLENTNKLKSLQGQKLKVSDKNNQLMINDSSVIASDIFATNGVIHVIDTVLLPKSK